MTSNQKKKVRGIQVNPKWCKSCGICVEFCPAQVFTMKPLQAPLPARLEDCTACRFCEMRCTDYAISVEVEG